jgi:hypothetical protein
MRFDADAALRYRDWLMRQMYGDMWTEAGARWPGLPPTSATGGGTQHSGRGAPTDATANLRTTNITINAGTIIADDYSVQQFARRIQRELRESS